ncbi:MAG: GntR family transcriptional regulator [Salinarimonas sp.]|nr:GntR family transcriptional regulator [Salinarimonas sp.]
MDRTNGNARLTAMERVYGEIRSAIISGNFPVGSRITEEMLAERLSVSRTPVRAALQRLASEGFIDMASHIGAVVKVWSPEEARQIYEVRARLEGMGARLAARNAQKADIARLSRIAAAIAEEGVTGEGGTRRSERNRDFHLLVLELSGNSHLHRTAANLMHVGLLVQAYASFNARDAQRSDFDHFDLVAAIESRDADWAEAVMHAHIMAASNIFVAAERAGDHAIPGAANGDAGLSGRRFG